MAARHRGTPPRATVVPRGQGGGPPERPVLLPGAGTVEPQHGPLLGRWRYSRWGEGRSRKPPRTLKLRPSPRIRGDAAEARLRVSEASCASRCLLPPTLAPRSAFGSWQVPFHLVQVPGTLPKEARRPPGPCPSPSQQSSSGPRLRTELYEGPTPPRLAPVGGSARVTSLGLGMGDPHGHPPGCQVEPDPRWGVSGSIGWGFSPTWNPTWARVARGVSPPLPHTHMHTYRHR